MKTFYTTQEKKDEEGGDLENAEYLVTCTEQLQTVAQFKRIFTARSYDNEVVLSNVRAL